MFQFVSVNMKKSRQLFGIVSLAHLENLEVFFPFPAADLLDTWMFLLTSLFECLMGQHFELRGDKQKLRDLID